MPDLSSSCLQYLIKFFDIFKQHLCDGFSQSFDPKCTSVFDMYVLAVFSAPDILAFFIHPDPLKVSLKMQLVAIDRNQNLHYYDNFLLRLDAIKEYIIIMPSENENDFTYITFKRNFVHPPNFQRILYADNCKLDSNRYLLIFVNDERCIKFVESVKTGKAKNKLIINISQNDEIFKNRYLTPIAEACRENPFMEEDLRPLLLEFLEFYAPAYENKANIAEDDVATVPTNTELLNHINENESVTTEKLNVASGVDDSSFEHLVNTNISNKDNGITVDYVTNQNNEENNQQFKPSKKTSSTRKRQRKQVIEGNVQPKKPKPSEIPSKCQNAFVEKHEVNEKTRCQQAAAPKPPIPDETKIVRKPKFQIFQRKVNGKMLNKLAIFNACNGDEMLCYEYTWSERLQFYICYTCNNHFNKHITARIIKNDDEEEYVRMGNISHKCELKKFVL